MLIDPCDPRPSWLLLRTKPRQERIAAEHLGSRHLPVYLPRVLEPVSQRLPHRGPVPMFPSYLFARAVVSDHFSAVRFCPGVAGLVRFGDLLAAVEDEVIEVLRAEEGERGYIVYKPRRNPLAAGARVRITRGPLTGLRGIVTRYLPASDRVRLLLDAVSIGRRVEVEAAAVCSG